MRLGLCPQLRRLWMRLVTNTVLPERLRPVTASQTVAPPASSRRLPDSRSDAWAKIGGSQPQFTTDDILIRSLPPSFPRGRPADLWNMGSRSRGGDRRSAKIRGHPNRPLSCGRVPGVVLAAPRPEGTWVLITFPCPSLDKRAYTPMFGRYA